MRLSQRDKRLLFILIIIAIIALPYFLVVRPLTTKTDTLNTEVVTLEAQYKKLSDLNENREIYIANTSQMIEEKQKIIKLFPSSIKQEAVIKFIYETEQNVNVILATMGLAINVETPITEDTSLEAGITAVSTTTQLTYSCSYLNFKRLIAYIEGYTDRMVITDISASYDETTDIISGGISLSQYALQSADREPVETKIPDIKTGTTNPFISNTEGYTNVSLDDVDQDYFMILAQVQADVAGKTIGRAYDSTEESYLESASNSKESVVVKITGSNDNYHIYYSIGSKSYEEDFNAGNSLDFAIISSPRVGEDDQVSISLTVTNDSDMALNLYIVSDDEVNPRVNLVGKTGEINVMK